MGRWVGGSLVKEKVSSFCLQPITHPPTHPPTHLPSRRPCNHWGGKELAAAEEVSI